MHHFYEVLEHEFNRATRYNNDVALVFIKIGRLAEIGQLYGNLAARRLLRKVERLIGANIRRIDWQFNYEKDELMIILPDTTTNGARCMVAKLTRLIESCPYTDRGGTRIDLSPQFSIASYAHFVEAGGDEIRLAGNDA